jgi:hypothetical protein
VKNNLYSNTSRPFTQEIQILFNYNETSLTHNSFITSKKQDNNSYFLFLLSA